MNKAKQANMFYKTANVSTVSFVNITNGKDDIEKYYSYEGNLDNHEYLSYFDLENLFVFSKSGDMKKIESVIVVDNNIELIKNYPFSLSLNQVALGNEVAKDLNLKKRDTVKILGLEFEVSHIIEDPTKDISNSTLINQLSFNKINEENNKEDGLFIFTSYDDLNEIDIGKIDNSLSLIEGNLPDEENNIIVSSRLYKKSLFNGKKVGDKIQIPILYYSNKTKNELDRNTIEFTISGISDDNSCGIYVLENKYEQLSSFYSQNSFDNSLKGYTVFNPKTSDFNKAYNLNLIDYSSISDNFKTINGYIKSWGPIFITFSAILLIIAMIIIFINIKSLINSNNKEMGVLVSLDYDKKYFKYIFTFDLLYVSLSSIIISIPLGIGIIYFYNKLIMKEYKMSAMCVYYTPWVVLIYVLLIIILTISVTLFATSKINKKTNIELIYGK